ncbi:hypothetical protein Z948_2036 [Sulfitobacter donghicola DSW-25 = KCTC 12864 = JCM 14565]|nr:hypothetical protein Z948_2036 [Sulfitobacter donghicola DSW-25 = KCTC 12864 = JCM 14565]
MLEGETGCPYAFLPNVSLDAREFSCEIFGNIAALKRMFIALHLQNDYANR